MPVQLTVTITVVAENQDTADGFLETINSAVGHAEAHYLPSYLLVTNVQATFVEITRQDQLRATARRNGGD